MKFQEFHSGMVPLLPRPGYLAVGGGSLRSAYILRRPKCAALMSLSTLAEVAEGFLSHGGTPKSSIYSLGLSIKNHSKKLLGYPHDDGNLRKHDVWNRL